jgi:hypothetical protein
VGRGAPGGGAAWRYRRIVYGHVAVHVHVDANVDVFD